ncbi:hypothetical protein DYB37_012227 [Aphanomyces astaci]|uniref:glucan endo-1,3-beta-D-glucosidase n=2 Tax=Aphanomyces astaci TaxID=112090 RepID=A0A397AWA0_APHAT|nr:hypothetical protein DYB25_012410 [Aphanomyces astaci]RHZ31381.1 hypothetical protein DYB37_012227 [Aphanomyces astaci]
MLYHIVLPVLGLFVLATSVIAEGFGVCYDSYDSANMPAHFRTIKQRFESVRTFQTAMGNQNAITVAANAGLKIAAGVWLLGNRYQEDLDAAIAGAKANPNAVQVIFIGNEELHQGWNAARLTSVVQDAKAKLAAAGVRVPVGIVQTDGDLLANPGLADLVDIVGANIHPFFSGAPDSTTDPIKDLKRRYEAVVAKFGSKVRVTEVGWPSQGGSFQGHTASAALSEKFYYDVKGWQQSTGTAAYYFMYHDNLGKGGFESYFGIAHPNGQWKFGGTPVYPPTDAPTTKPPAPTTATPEQTTKPPATYFPTSPPTTASPTITLARPTTTPPPTTLAPTTNAPLTTATSTTTSRPVTPIVTNNSTNNSTNTSDITFPPQAYNSTSSTNSTNNSTNSSDITFPPQAYNSTSSTNASNSITFNRVNVQATNSANGVDVGAISGVAIGGFAVAAIAVIGVVRHRGAQAI